MRWKHTLVVGVPILALIIAVTTIKFSETETPHVSILGSEWQCHELLHVQVCNHAAQGISHPKLQYDASTRL